MFYSLVQLSPPDRLFLFSSQSNELTWSCYSRRQITPNSPKFLWILWIKTKYDLWSKKAAKDGHQSENDLDHVTHDVELPLSLKSCLILSVVAKPDLWTLIQYGFQNGSQSEYYIGQVTRNVKLPLIAQSRAWSSHCNKTWHLTIDPRWLPKWPRNRISPWSLFSRRRITLNSQSSA